MIGMFEIEQNFNRATPASDSHGLTANDCGKRRKALLSVEKEANALGIRDLRNRKFL